ncbi:unnamed protein product [Ilex paraguariensis]|uniref:Uncharacterized protein n=1 Tax=Ilex paraguariensis TaxID=185542 RepID=A0ABC8S011_9AQUA
MAVDASFLLEFLQIFPFKQGKEPTRVSSRMSHLVDVAGRKSAHNAILRDIVMLENQIPLFLLRKMLEIQFSSMELANNMLVSMLMGLCEELSPFKFMEEEHPNLQISKRAHLLDVLYHVFMPEFEEPTEITEAEEERGKEGEDHGALRSIKRLLFARPIKVILKLPWTIVSKLPVFKVLKQGSEYFCFPHDKENIKPENENSSDKPPLVEEISIPSVTKLSEVGVKFSSTNGGTLNFGFDCKTVTLYLPTISLDVNTEVTLRNLVAYESCNASGPLVLTRYTELMNGIIDTAEDAKLLRERGIIVNRLKNDKDVANMWNGMSRSVKLTKVPFLDKVIQDVNKYYDS